MVDDNNQDICRATCIPFSSHHNHHHSTGRETEASAQRHPGSMQFPGIEPHLGQNPTSGSKIVGAKNGQILPLLSAQLPSHPIL